MRKFDTIKRFSMIEVNKNRTYDSTRIGEKLRCIGIIPIYEVMQYIDDHGIIVVENIDRIPKMLFNTFDLRSCHLNYDTLSLYMVKNDLILCTDTVDPTDAYMARHHTPHELSYMLIPVAKDQENNVDDHLIHLEDVITSRYPNNATISKEDCIKYLTGLSPIEYLDIISNTSREVDIRC